MVLVEVGVSAPFPLPLGFNEGSCCLVPGTHWGGPFQRYGGPRVPSVSPPPVFTFRQFFYFSGF